MSIPGKNDSPGYFNTWKRYNIRSLRKVGRVKSISAYYFRYAILSANYWLNNYKDIFWLIGDGRSGTTWVANLINYEKKYREMFEPFHPKFVKGMDCIQPHQYIRPHDDNRRLRELASAVFSGKFINNRVDLENNRLIYKGIIIKDVFANLFACWATRQFPQIKPILLIRNPFAVALSKNKKKHWFWMTDPTDFLAQPDLVEDYLYPFESLIRKIGNSDDYILRQVCIWAVIHYIPLVQLSPDRLHIVFYEDAYNDPHGETAKIFGYLGLKKKSLDIPDAVINRVIRASKVSGGKDCTTRIPPDFWKDRITRHQMEQGMKILSAFGLDRLYNENSMPDRQRLSMIINGNGTS